MLRYLRSNTYKLFLIVAFVAISQGRGFAQSTETRATFDLSSYDFENNAPISLDGEWEFYWEQLLDTAHISGVIPTSIVQFPHLWNNFPELSSNGYATYRARVELASNELDLALDIPDTYSSYRMFVNGVLVAENGVVAATREAYTPKWVRKTISLAKFQNQQIEIIFQVANFDHHKGGIWQSPVIGLQQTIESERDTRLSYAIFLAGSIIMAGLFFFGLYAFGRHEKAILYFALFSLIYSYRLMGTDPYPLHIFFPDLPWLLTTKLEFLSMFLSVSFFGLFIQSLYPDECSTKVTTPFNIYFFVFSAGIVVLPASVFTLFLNFFFIPAIIYVLYATWVFVKALINRREGAVFAVSSSLVLFIVFIHTRLQFIGIVEENRYFEFLGYISFFVLQSLVLSYRFAHFLKSAKEKAETASVAKSHFLSTMGHELRTPLNAVIGLSELLLESKSEEEKTDFARTIKKSGENLLQIINNILDFTRIELGDIKVESVPVNLRFLLHDVVEILSSLIGTKPVQIVLDIHEDVQDHISTDPIGLRQVIINLISNSIKFTNEGEITVSINPYHDDKKGDLLLFSVKDTGIGIPIDKQETLFDSFTQLDATTTRKYGGTGLGLSITRRLIEEMGGEIWLESEPGVGSKFSFTLKPVPVHTVELIDQLAENSVDEDESFEDLRILAAEDNLINQKVVTKIVERLNIKIDVVNNGLEALERVSASDYDIVFMDMEMPEMDGIESTIRIRKLENRDLKPRIIAMTANTSEEDKEKCLAAGMDDFISKPITLDDIRQLVRKWAYTY